MPQFFLERTRVDAFVAHLMSRKAVYAPHRKGRRSFVFKKTEDPTAVVLEYPRTMHSVKKFFLPPREVLLTYDLVSDVGQAPAIEPSDAVFLGVHSYDLAAVKRLDHNFSTGNPERNYLERRQGAVFVGVSYVPDKWHFAGSVGIDPYDMSGCDMFLTRHPEGWIVDVLTTAGTDLCSGFRLSNHQESKPPREHFTQHIYVPQARLSSIMEASYNHPVWAETAATCVGCGTCNLVCPTCFCFDVEETVDITATSGQRDRSWDGCMLRSFSQVAGGEVFREKLSARQRHRVFRKFKYISDAAGHPWCVGCGRCTASCTAGISIVNIVNRLVGDAEHTGKVPV